MRRYAKCGHSCHVVIGSGGCGTQTAIVKDLMLNERTSVTGPCQILHIYIYIYILQILVLQWRGTSQPIEFIPTHGVHPNPWSSIFFLGGWLPGPSQKVGTDLPRAPPTRKHLHPVLLALEVQVPSSGPVAPGPDVLGTVSAHSAKPSSPYLMVRYRKTDPVSNP